MKMYTSIEWEWSDKLGKLVEIHSESFNYEGEVALCAGRYKYSENLQETVFDTEGNEYRIYRRKWRTHRNRGSTKNRDYIIRKFDKSGQEVAINGRIGSKRSDANAGGRDTLKDMARGGAPDNRLLTGAELSDYNFQKKESARLELKASDAIADAKSATRDTTARQVDIAQRQTARVSGEAIRQQKQALLAQGYSPEEAQMMGAQGSENVARAVADVGRQGMALQSQALGGLATMGAEQQWTAENLSQNIRQMQQDLMKHRESLANNLQIAKMEASAAGDAAMGQAAGQTAMAIGTAIASDVEIKDNILYVGLSPKGHKMYEFNYKDCDGRWLGVMAQDVLLTDDANAVVIMPEGHYGVDYTKVDVDFARID